MRTSMKDLGIALPFTVFIAILFMTGFLPISTTHHTPPFQDADGNMVDGSITDKTGGA